MSTHGRVIVITGAAGGLGKALCQELMQLGDTLVALDNNRSALTRLANELQYPQLSTHTLDVSDAQAIKVTIARIEHRHGRIDVLINNAGITQIAAVDEINALSLDKVMNVNFRGAALLAIAATPALRKSQGSHVVISSVAGFSPLLWRAAYSASKHALAGFFATLKAEERMHGVHVLLVSPSFIATNVGAFDMSSDIQRPGAADDSLDRMSPSTAAKAIVSALEKRQETLYLGRVAKLSNLLQRLSPRLFEHLMRRTMR